MVDFQACFYARQKRPKSRSNITFSLNYGLIVPQEAFISTIEAKNAPKSASRSTSIPLEKFYILAYTVFFFFLFFSAEEKIPSLSCAAVPVQIALRFPAYSSYVT